MLSFIALILAGRFVVTTGPGEQFTRPFGFPLLATSIDDVRARLGRAQIRETGDAGEYEMTICYVASKTRARVTFVSGEMGGDHHDLTAFRIGAEGRANVRGCLPSPEWLDKAVGVGVGGVRVGMSKRAFEQLVDHAELLSDGRLAAGFEHRDAMTPEQQRQASEAGESLEYPYWDTAIFVAGRFVRDRLIELTVEKTMTR